MLVVSGSHSKTQILFNQKNTKMKKITKIDKTDLLRLRAMKIPTYVKFYQLMSQVNVTAAYIEFKAHSLYSNQKVKVLTVEHKTGRFSFPIEDIAPNINTDELKAIFFNLLKMPVPNCTITVKQKIAA